MPALAFYVSSDNIKASVKQLRGGEFRDVLLGSLCYKTVYSVCATTELSFFFAFIPIAPGNSLAHAISAQLSCLCSRISRCPRYWRGGSLLPDTRRWAGPPLPSPAGAEPAGVRRLRRMERSPKVTGPETGGRRRRMLTGLGSDWACCWLFVRYWGQSGTQRLSGSA